MKKNSSPTIEFVNHASVLISFDKISILSDPWYKGSAFNLGWRLMYENEHDKVIDVLKKTTHIYISHEHPDHFRPDFFKSDEIIKILINKKVVILFQKTKDKRVVNFLSGLGLKVRELGMNEKLKLNENLEVQIIKFGLYDSCILMKTQKESILNINDCPLHGRKELIKFKKKYGTADILLTQFSYASGFFGHSKYLRIQDAKERLKNIEIRAKILECNTIIPFASFINFSNELNFHLNDSINTPDTVKNYFASKSYNIVVLSPGEIQQTNNLSQNINSLSFWREKFALISTKRKDKYEASIDLNELKDQFINYKKRIFGQNSEFLIKILYKIKFLNFFQPLIIKLSDHNQVYRYSIFSGLNKIDNSKKFDIKMHSQVLSFIFKYEYGFDTLTVNGCFETNQKGLEKAIKALSIEILNSMGVKLNLKLLFNFNLMFYFFKNLNSLKRKNIEQP